MAGLYNSIGNLRVTINDTSLSFGTYAADGSLRVTEVDGSAFVGLYAADGSLNVITVTGADPLGSTYHPCGAIRGVPADGNEQGVYAPNGALYMEGLSTANRHLVAGTASYTITGTAADLLPIPSTLTLVEDGLEEDPPFYTLSTTAAGLLVIDFHSSATPPAKGSGDIGTILELISTGATVLNLDLSAYGGETGYLHFQQISSNVLTSQEITVSGAWSPTDFGADLLGWWDASDSGSITRTGADVTQWSDLSGNGEHLTQGTSGRYPQYSATGFNSSYPGLTFSDDRLECAGFANVSDKSISHVVIMSLGAGAVNNDRIIGWSKFPGAPDFSSPNMTIYVTGGPSIGAYRDADKSSKVLSLSTPAVAISVCDGTNHTTYIDGSAGTPVSVGASNFETDVFLVVGSYSSEGGTADTSFFDGTIAEMFIVNRALTSGEITEIQDYAVAKWGL